MENNAFVPESIPAVGWYLEKKWTLGDKKRQRALHERVVEHMMKQRKRAKSEDGRPMYRDHKRQRDPIGFALGEHYDEAFEGKSIAHQPLQEALKANGVNLRDVDVLDALRWVHDHHSTNVWQAGFEFVSDMMGLGTVESPLTPNGPTT